MTLDLNHHMQLASKSSFPNIAKLCDRNVPLKDRLRYFDAIVTAVAVFGSGHHTIHPTSWTFACRKVLGAVIGPPSNVDRSRPWHEMFHDWNGKVESLTLEHGLKLWNHRSLQ